MHSNNLWRDIPWLWTVFVGYFVFSVRRVRVKRIVSVPKFTIENCGVALATLLIFFPKTHLSFLALRFTHSAAVEVTGLCLTVAGLALSAWSREILGKNWSARPLIQVDHQLIMDGPYAYLRHPLYSGILVALAGTALVSGEFGALLGWILSIAYFWSKARREEFLLQTEFGASYTDYCAHTGFIIPRIAHL